MEVKFPFIWHLGEKALVWPLKETVRASQAYLYGVTDAKVYGMSRDHYKSIHSREVAMVAFGWFMRMQDGEEYEGYEYVGIFDLWALDPPPPVVTDEWVDLHLGG